MHMDYEVFVNGVRAGKLTEEEYDLQRDIALKSGPIHLLQAGNILWGLAVLAGRLLWIFPIISFYGLLYLAIWDAESFHQVVSAFQSDQLGVRRVMERLLPVAFVTLLSVFTVMDGGKSLGFRNVFDTAINDGIRRKLGIQAIGDITVFRLIPQYTRQASPRYILDLPIIMVFGYGIATWFFVMLTENIFALIFTPLIAHGVLHYSYRNGKLDRFLSLADKWRQRWEQRRQEKRKA